jgi:hypothetical protein
VTKVAETIEVQVAPERVWSIIGAPESIAAWHPAISSSPMKDRIRHCTLASGEKVDEQIVEHSDDEQFYVYTILSSPFEMSGYRSRIQVQGTNDGARIIWDGEFEADSPETANALAEAFSGVYRAGLDSIQNLTESTELT